MDIGTAGGKRFMVLAAPFGRGMDIDTLSAMVDTARRNRPDCLADWIVFVRMDAEVLGFPEASFDLVLNRHAGLCAEEIARVLRPGGYLIVQQVGEAYHGERAYRLWLDARELWGRPVAGPHR